MNHVIAEVHDPVCGMTFAPDHAAGTHVHNGETYHFCSESCLDRFRQDPERFLRVVQSAAPPTPGAEYTCPMHPEIGQMPQAPARSAAWRSNRASPRSRRRQSRTPRHDASLLDRRRAHHPDSCRSCLVHLPIAWLEARAGHAGRPLGRLAVLRARLAVV